MTTWLEKLIEAAKELDTDKLAILCVTLVGITVTVCHARDNNGQTNGETNQDNAAKD